ncbi:MAG TPA: Rrf2 family transcriptional regulator [Egibacteraceae bacterium]|nr:Rrf2 family transcriptional regulator [Egibacteraceae bacterium]
MRVSAKVDYAVRAAVALAQAADEDAPVKGERIATAQGIPLKFLENILGDMRRAGLVRSQRGAVGGYRLALGADEISVADIVRAVEGPLGDVRGMPPERVSYDGGAEALQQVWLAARASLRSVMETVTVADIATGQLPDLVDELLAEPEAWVRR